MKNIIILKRSLLKKILNFMGVCSTGLMVYCTKYGAPEAPVYPMHLNGTVKSTNNEVAIEGIEVFVHNSSSDYIAYTDSQGVFSLLNYFYETDNFAHLEFRDLDGDINGSYQSKDTIINISSKEKQAHYKPNIDIKLDTID